MIRYFCGGHCVEVRLNDTNTHAITQTAVTAWWIMLMAEDREQVVAPLWAFHTRCSRSHYRSAWRLHNSWIQFQANRQSSAQCVGTTHTLTHTTCQIDQILDSHSHKMWYIHKGCTLMALSGSIPRTSAAVRCYINSPAECQCGRINAGTQSLAVYD